MGEDKMNWNTKTPEDIEDEKLKTFLSRKLTDYTALPIHETLLRILAEKRHIFFNLKYEKCFYCASKSFSQMRTFMHITCNNCGREHKIWNYFIYFEDEVYLLKRDVKK